MAIAVPTVPVEAVPGVRRGQFLRSMPLKAKVGAAILGLFVLIAIIGTGDRAVRPERAGSPPKPRRYRPTPTISSAPRMTAADVFSQLLVSIRGTSPARVLERQRSRRSCRVAIGVTAGFLGGLADEGLSLVANVFLVLPALPLLIIVLTFLPHSGVLVTATVLSILGWAWGARVIRAQTLTLRGRVFVAAARETGEPTWRLVVFEVLPNEISLIAASFVGTFLYAILTSVALAYIGVANLNDWSLGVMLYWQNNSTAINTGAWWWYLPPWFARGAFARGGLGAVPTSASTSSATRGCADRRQRGAPGPGARPTRRRYNVWRPHDERDGRAQRQHDKRRWRCATSRDSRPVGRLQRRRQGRRSRRGDLPRSRRGETVGLAGESGCGKSTLALGLCRLLRPPAVITSGSVCIYRGSPSPGRRRRSHGAELARAAQAALARDLRRLPERDERAEPRPARARRKLGDALDAHLKLNRHDKASWDRLAELLDLVGIPRERLRSYPHELSGGMRQRVMIAMALAAEPEVVIMDEPTTALDVVVQREILAQVVALQEQLGFAVLFITHDLSLLLEIADRIAVMYAGKIVEIGTAEQIHNALSSPLYARGLLGSFPSVHGPRKQLAGIPGSPPDLRALPPGCPFVPRCTFAADACREVDMSLAPVVGNDENHRTACPFVRPEERGAAAATAPGGVTKAAPAAGPKR